MRYLYIIPIIISIASIIAFVVVRKYRLKLTVEEIKQLSRRTAIVSIVLVGMAIIACLMAFYMSHDIRNLFPISLCGIILILGIENYRRNKSTSKT